MPSTKRAVGLESILVGPVQSGYSILAASLATIANIVPDTAKMTFDVPEAEQFYVEDSDDVDVEIQGNAKKGIEFATQDMGIDVFLLAFGGSSGATLWRAPTTATVTIERMVRITTKVINGTQLQFDIPHMSLRASGDLKFSKKGVGNVAFQGTILKCGSTSPLLMRQI